MIVSKSNVVRQGNFQVPKGRYICQVVDATFNPQNNSGNPMVTLDCEIVSPSPVALADGSSAEIAGKKFQIHLVLTGELQPDGKSYKGPISNVLDLHDKLGIAGDLDTENPPLDSYRGVSFAAILDSEEEVALQRRLPGEKVGKPILDDNNQPVKLGWKLKTVWPNAILGKVEGSANRPY